MKDNNLKFTTLEKLKEITAWVLGVLVFIGFPISAIITVIKIWML
jgi:hypothetical protein